MTSICVHPLTKEPFVADMQGNLHAGSTIVPVIESCCDFAHLQDTTEDRTYYDKHYHHNYAISSASTTVESVRRLWECNSSFALLYHSVGDIKGKTILLLGNGISLKELRFVAEGANVVYTDISLHAVLAVKRAYENSSLARHSTGQIEFHAVDALHLPFGDEVFDVIYGCALVHHIQDLCAFFGQVRRCLKAGGKCVFLDDAYSPMWQFAKTTALRPLQMFSQWRSGISPEDKFATQRGGYRLEELQGIQTSYGFRELMYQRTMFLEHLARRGSAKLLTKGIGEVFAPVGRFIDVTVPLS